MCVCRKAEPPPCPWAPHSTLCILPMTTQHFVYFFDLVANLSQEAMPTFRIINSALLAQVGSSSWVCY